ncbi:MAG: flagellar export chaperone FliS [Gammaproteobacteria bacterium]|nr:MAG: flagellar export chaperone FliS [Gammaproteobacteria bacterium]PIE35113.1 MAG: flagellar export chaperone FliS [Gammaproteobacteria bacterium]
MQSKAGVAAYLDTRRATVVEGASAHELTAMLMQGAIERIAIARGMIGHGDMAGKGQVITRCIDIVDELMGSLNMEAGGEMARNLMALYEYCKHGLLEASLHNDVDRLDEIAGLIGTLHEGWQAMPASERAA